MEFGVASVYRDIRKRLGEFDVAALKRELVAQGRTQSPRCLHRVSGPSTGFSVPFEQAAT